MPNLNNGLNDPAVWTEFLAAVNRRVEVDLDEVERVIELARRTPGLAEYHEEFQQLSIFFAVATQVTRTEDPEGLVGLVQFWERYRAAVLQRYVGVTPVEFRAADKVVRDIFQRFLDRIPNQTTNPRPCRPSSLSTHAPKRRLRALQRSCSLGFRVELNPS